MTFEVIAAFTRRPLFGYRLSVYAMLTVGVLSMIVWGHHMFTTGMNPYVGEVLLDRDGDHHGAVLGAWREPVASLWRAKLRLKTPMLFALGVISAVGSVAWAACSSGRDGLRHLLPRNLLRGRPLPSDDRHGHPDGDLRRGLLLVPEDVRPQDGREARPLALLAHLGADDQRSSSSCTCRAWAAWCGAPSIPTPTSTTPAPTRRLRYPITTLAFVLFAGPGDLLLERLQEPAQGRGRRARTRGRRRRSSGRPLAGAARQLWRGTCRSSPAVPTSTAARRGRGGATCRRRPIRAVRIRCRKGNAPGMTTAQRAACNRTLDRRAARHGRDAYSPAFAAAYLERSTSAADLEAHRLPRSSSTWSTRSS